MKNFGPDLLKGEVAVVTGAAQGNGEAIALGLARAGAAVLAVDMNAKGAGDVARKIVEEGGRASGHGLDVCDRAACFAFAEQAGEAFGGLSILVNNAGITRRAAPADPGFLDHLDAQIAVNLSGMANVTIALLPLLKQTRGRIVNVGSIASFVAYRNSASYAASKGAVLQLTRALALDLAADGIRVNGVAPGVIATPMTAVTRETPGALGGFLAHTPLGRVGEPGELVGPVIFLASEMSSYVTGVMLPVDGGYLTS